MIPVLNRKRQGRIRLIVPGIEEDLRRIVGDHVYAARLLSVSESVRVHHRHFA